MSGSSFQSKQKNKRTTYKRITEQVRLQLIERVMQKGQNVKEVVNDMGINISTAKAILKVYQQEGRVGKKKKRDKVINVIQTYSFYTVDGTNIEKIADTVIQQEKKSLQSAQSKDVQKQLKEKSRQRAEQLMKQAIEKMNSTNETAQLTQNINDLTALQNQMFLQFCNQGAYQFNGMGFPYK